MKDENRVIGLDIVRCVALLFIIGVHFFYNNGFYFEPQQGAVMIVADTVRWLTFSCVPLFIILTGYLKAEAGLSKKYYKGIVPILVAWIVISVICMVFKGTYIGTKQTMLQWITEFLNYKGADYSWYIELYIGLFLLCPFLNGFFNWEKDGKYHFALLVTMLVTAYLPSLLNNITTGGVVLNLVPDYFVSMWPFAYYFMGCALRKYQFRLSTFTCIFGAGVLSLIKALMTYMSAEGENFYKGIGGGYSDFFVAGITLFVFMALYQAEVKNMWLRRFFAHISKRSLHIYLLSSVADLLMNDVFREFHKPSEYWWLFWVKCMLVFVISLAMSEVVYPITTAISRWIMNLVPAWRGTQKR